MKHILFVCALFLVFASPPTVAQTPANISIRIDELFEPWASVDTPGCAVGIAKDGLTVFERAYGMADLEWEIPNSTETIFEAGSVSKQFTAAAVVLIALDGRLRLDDDIRKYIPEVPDYGHKITIRHLLSHTSGLRDWGRIVEISGWDRERRAHTQADVLDILSRQTRLNHEPGTMFAYTNSGFNLLAILVDRVSGMSFVQFSNERIFQPLGLEHTQWRDDHRRIIKGRSSAYNVRDNGAVEINRPIEDVYGNGGLLTTIGDLLSWNQALTDERFGPDFKLMMETPARLDDGRTIEYAYGLRVGDQAGMPAIYHAGSRAGYRSYTGRIPEAGLAWAFLCNASNGRPEATRIAVLREFLGDMTPPKPVPPEGVSITEARVRELAGVYRNPLDGSIMTLTAQDGRLYREQDQLIPISDSEFVLGATGQAVSFEDADNKRHRAHLDIQLPTWQAFDVTFEQVEPWRPTPRQLTEFTGTFHSDDAETTYQIRIKNGQLVAWRRPDVTIGLAPIYRDGFQAGGGIVWFRRDGSGHVSELSLGLPRVFDMRFQKIRD
jgi:CubicO group peptidase (beta-lactamase class C family)